MLLGAAFHQISAKADRHPLSEVAPLMRRPAEVDPHGEYPQVSVRSFGRGTFHNPPLKGSEITWQKPYLVKQDDILVSNIKAWEGALAVAGPEDDGRFGSHRYLTFVPVEGVITSNFLCFYLLTREGLHHVGEAAPGSADRNRTLRSKDKCWRFQFRFQDFEINNASMRSCRRFAPPAKCGRRHRLREMP